MVRIVFNDKAEGMADHKPGEVADVTPDVAAHYCNVTRVADLADASASTRDDEAAGPARKGKAVDRAVGAPPSHRRMRGRGE